MNGKELKDSEIISVKIEVDIRQNDYTFYYWDFIAGEDVVVNITSDGKILQSNTDSEGNDLPGREIEFKDFLNLLKSSALNSKL